MSSTASWSCRCSHTPSLAMMMNRSRRPFRTPSEHRSQYRTVGVGLMPASESSRSPRQRDMARPGPSCRFCRSRYTRGGSYLSFGSATPSHTTAPAAVILASSSGSVGLWSSDSRIADSSPVFSFTAPSTARQSPAPATHSRSPCRRRASAHAPDWVASMAGLSARKVCVPSKACLNASKMSSSSSSLRSISSTRWSMAADETMAPCRPCPSSTQNSAHCGSWQNG
mmetsp:Transcript_16382/g.53359  ORF Transcript_16382/g.53359 Transcript_16382/m.53359 type:complete len:226 (+) Transcript_16382:602-1279(+)